MTPFVIRPVAPADAAAIQAIYAPYVAETVISFEETPPDVTEIAARLAAHPAGHPWLVTETDGAALAYAYGAPFHRRGAYRFTSEVSIYVAREARGRGLGRRLFAALLEALEGQGQRQAIGLITLPNAPSVALHEAFGFRHAGTLRAVGWKFGAWRDVGYWQRALGVGDGEVADAVDRPNK